MKTKFALIAITIITSLPLQAKTVCRVNVDGKSATQVESNIENALSFERDNLTVIAQSVAGKPNRMRFVFLKQNPTKATGPKAAYVVAAFREDRLNVAPEINGQQMSVSCLRK